MSFVAYKSGVKNTLHGHPEQVILSLPKGNESKDVPLSESRNERNPYCGTSTRPNTKRLGLAPA